MRWRVAAAFGAAAAVLVTVAAVDPNDPASPYPLCPFFAMTGHYCPGCGTLRALHALVHGDVGTALGQNLLVVVGLVALAAYAVIRRPVPRWLLPLSVAVVIGFTVLRNVPGLAWLAPT